MMHENPANSENDLHSSESSLISISPPSNGRLFSVSAGFETESAPFTTLTAAFYAQVKDLWSSGIAVWEVSANGGGEKFTYQDLAARVQALSRYLKAERVKRGQKVPLITNKGLESVTGILAILSCGAQFVPVDCEFQSDDYIRAAVEWSGQSVILSTSLESDDVLQRVFPRAARPKPIRIVRIHSQINVPHLYHDCTWQDLAKPDDVCYTVIKCGTPSETARKVHIKHRNVVNLICLGSGSLGVCPGVHVGQTLSLASDIAVWEIFGCLCNGGTLVIGNSQQDAVLSKVEVLVTTPTLLSQLEPQQLPKLKVLATAGETISDYLADKWAARVPTVWKCYGSAETTIVCAMSRHSVVHGTSSGRCDLRQSRFGCPVLNGRDGTNSVGHPISNSVLYVLDNNGRKRPVGHPGQIWVGGRGVSDHYVGYDQDSYVLNPFRGDRSHLYRTEDCGICHKDGSIELLPPVPIADYTRSKQELSAVELQRLTSAWSCTAGTTQVAVLSSGLQMYFFSVQQHVEDTIQEVLRSNESMDEHLKILQRRGQIPAEAHIDPDNFHSVVKIPIESHGKLDREKLRFEVIRHQMESPPGVMRSMIDTPLSVVLPRSISPVKPIPRRRKRGHRSAVLNLFAIPAEIFQNMKNSR